MSQKKQARHLSNCQVVAETSVIAIDDSKSNVPSQKRKEDAKEVLYLNRV